MDLSNILLNAPGIPLTQTELDAQLLKAACYGQTANLSALLIAGANVNAVDPQGNTALMLAAENGRHATALILIPLLDLAALNSANQLGQTALMLAAFNGHTTIASVLINAGANVERANPVDGFTILMLAASHGHTSMVSILIPHLNVLALNAKNKNGETALMLAAENGHTAIVIALIASGATVNTVNNNGENALTLTAMNNHRETVFRFLSALSFQQVVAIQFDPLLGNFSTRCRQVVFNLQRGIFNILRTFGRTQALSDINGPIRLVISNLCPQWYRHRANRDITLLSQRLTSLLEERENARVPQLELPLNASVTLAFSSESETSVTDPSLFTEEKAPGFSI